ncbi:MAG: protein kinase [Luteitalea sp.]|nr:protein kinase [Luteitalea sp.]
MTMNIDPNWALETAFAEISSRYRPGSYWHGRTRNVLLQMWGEVVGRTRATTELAALIGKCGSRNKFSKEYSISSGPLAELEAHFAALPPDPEPKRNRLNAGDRVGPWKLLARLGRGGNSEVWSATSDTVPDAAVKIPNGGRNSLRRFAGELTLMGKLNGTKGVMPLIAGANDEGHMPWLAMPIAKPIMSALDEDDPLFVFTGTIQVLETLTSLHGSGISHRDIKPDNIYLLDGSWVLADFGIASFPGKEALTEAGRKLGPMFYIAPEMLTSPDTADGRPADIYSLAKTVWVLLSGQTYPPPGEQRASVEGLRISSYVDLECGAKLDELLEECTRHDPHDRPSAALLCERLTKMLQ